MLTGREYFHEGTPILEYRCPHCEGLQWHLAGNVKCAYCDKDLRVSKLSIVKPVAVSGETPETVA